MVTSAQQIIIIGTGFAGLAMAYRLKQAGLHTSLFWSVRRKSVAPGEIIITLAQLAMWRLICILSLSHRIPVGRESFHLSRKF